MAEIERVKTIQLTAPLEDVAQKISYTQLELKAPTLSQAEQFYEKQTSSTSLAAMRLLIALVTGTRESVLQPMDFIDFRKCEEYLLSFLTWKP
ncbi:phage tail assembly protein [Citrobacter freundii]|uniref:phage tail assembly protein n=1 Tax=Enterobacteriaceae TaxID=543 RepID=UPI0009B06302|nr:MULTISPECIES: phage tail assembly protein [Enterobacteriaceae]ECI0840758.1 phage tail assembly protein [Salmonella enterica subsp. diarizonae]EHJ8506504.1 phage tail assembly protein [Salmonella enterica subsp. diarizonae serovar 47:k:z53:[z84]]WGI48079.1 phage tail assembly protein [Salmonella enterica subsp. diarizonae serovar 48:i:z]EKS3673741.1 phage tail assembly protein [Salmonella enterica]ELW6563414.1 phage tail assembly protein [Salmonella enterica]